MCFSLLSFHRKTLCFGIVKKTKQVLLWLCSAILIFGLIGCDRIFPSGDLVERVSDGDTLALKNAKGDKFTVRFACIDAPEIPHTKKEKQSKNSLALDQFDWGVKAQERVQQLVQQGGDRVKLNITDSDRYGRKVAEVRLRNGTFIQEVLVREGLALVYRPYLSKCPSKDIIQQAETQARDSRQGVWSDSKFVKPWEYRSLYK
ncbi:nuclease [Nostocales cyanobacterium HT-58-2]|nr:nuclease [Nostocales cyanobacterium HT-58-2]